MSLAPEDTVSDNRGAPRDVPWKGKRRMADKPVIDLRIYTIRPRGMPQYLKLFEELALPLALKYLGEPLGY